ncbi:substrate-binding periplasmic protein [Chitinimonas sp.]|uniref:substrate-binding periplasmic protein n=1 Tax=Chitinimonas sp. TaxID=1934313 RepID=UPI0035B3D650
MMRLLSLMMLAPALASPLITIEYRDKPPYSYTEQGRPAGFLLTRMAAVFLRANVPVAFEEIPVRRITADLQANNRPICSPGWYKLPEREAYARFSLPIHQDPPHVVLAAPHAVVQIRAHKTLASLFADPNLTLGVVDGVSYGPELDARIAALPRPAMRASVSPLQLVKLIANRRADYMLIDQDDLSVLEQSSPPGNMGIVRFDFPDPPQGLKRYLMCSKQVDAATMERLNAAIRQVVPDIKP